MNEQSDQELLRNYVERKSDPAFATLVERYIDLVHSAAFRMSGDPHSAKDITQCVFVALSHNARRLTERPTVAGWLHNTARNLASKDIRSQIRRRTREQEAAAMNELLTTDSTANWEEIAPHLDAALGELSEPERDALLLRYFKNEDLRTVGATFGISEDAAQKRVSRAVEHLREFFAKRGITAGASGLVTVVSANAVQAAPVGLAITISTAAALTGTTLATTATKAIAMTTLQKTVVTTTVAVLAGVGIYEARQASQLHNQIQAMQQQQSLQTEQFQQLQADFAMATNRLVDLLAQNSRLKSDSTQTELLKLRGELARVKSEAMNETTSAAGAWLEKVNKLKQRLQVDSKARIPEMQFMTNNDLVKYTSGKLETEADFRRALATLRNSAEMHFGSLLQRALKEYVKANPGVPTDMDQFRSYFSEPIDETILQRWKIASGSKGPVRITDSDWVVTQKGAVDDVFDTSIGITARGIGSTDVFFSQSNQKVLGPVYEAFAAANPNHGEVEPQASQLLPFATTPEQQAVVEKLLLRQSATE